MKKLFLLPLAALLLVGCGAKGPTTGGEGGGTGDTGGNTPVEKVATYNFTGLTEETAKALDADGFKAILDANVTGTNVIASVTDVDKVYNGGGSGGCHENGAGLLKLGTGSVNGKFTFTLNEGVVATKVVVNMHDFYASSEQYPTPSDSFAVNGTAKSAVYNATGAGEDVEYTVSDANVLNFETSNTNASKGGRIYIFSLSIYTK